MARRTLLLIASILTAALGTALIWLYVQGADTRAQQTADLVPALFLTRDLEAGQPVAGSVVTKQVTPDVAASAYTDVTQLGALKLGVPGKQGALLVKSMLSSGPDGGARFPRGNAMALTFSPQNLVPADLKVGDVVDLYSVTAAGAKLVEKNLRVRSIGPLGGAGTAAAPGAAAGTGGAAAPVAGGGIPLTVVGFDVSEAQGAELYTEILGKRGEPALLLHDAAAPS